MRISKALQDLLSILEKHGDIELVSGLSRSGYGEPIIEIKVKDAYPFGVNKKEKVVELILSDSTSHTTSFETNEPKKNINQTDRNVPSRIVGLHTWVGRKRKSLSYQIKNDQATSPSRNRDWKHGSFHTMCSQ